MVREVKTPVDKEGKRMRFDEMPITFGEPVYHGKSEHERRQRRDEARQSILRQYTPER